MDQELQQAIQTFGMVPEFYQQAFKEAGADFPDELVKAIKADPNKAGELVTSDKSLQQAVLTIFKSNKDAITQYIQQQNTSMFKAGGKLDYLLKLSQGGKAELENKINKKYIKDSEKAGKEASKKMADLKQNHRAELKRIK